jgi:hypothetical protein
VIIFITGVLPTSLVRALFVLAGPCQYIGKALKALDGKLGVHFEFLVLGLINVKCSEVFRSLSVT